MRTLNTFKYRPTTVTLRRIEAWSRERCASALSRTRWSSSFMSSTPAVEEHQSCGTVSTASTTTKLIKAPFM